MLSPALTTLFNNFVARTGDLFVARLYTIQLSGGGVLRFADTDFNVLAVSTSPAPAPVNGQLYPATGIVVDIENSKTQFHAKVGLDTDTWVMAVMPRPFDLVTGAAFPDQIGNVAWLAAASAGALDAADFQVDEAYFSSVPTWPMPPGGMPCIDCKTIFAGTIAEVDITSTMAVISANDYRSILSISMPRHFFQAQCRHTLFDAGCNANGNMARAAFAVNGIVAAGSTQAVIVGQGLAVPSGSGTYTLGQVQMTGGLNAGFWRTVRSWDGSNTLALLNPLPFAVAPGDTFTAYPGCNKLTTTCSLFNNFPQFGGEPRIPPPEVTI